MRTAWNTGDGFVTPYTELGTLPGGLAGATDYWVIKTGANTLKLATSSSNAIAGTAVDITANGIGILGVGLPFIRARTLAPGSQIKSADLNALQAAAVGGGARKIPIAATGFVLRSGTATLANGIFNVTSTAQFEASLALPAGTSLMKLTFGYNRGGSGTVTTAIGKRNVASGAVSSPNLVVRSATDSTGAAWETGVYTNLNMATVAALDAAVADPEIMAGGFVYWLAINLPTGADFGGAGRRCDQAVAIATVLKAQ